MVRLNEQEMRKLFLLNEELHYDYNMKPFLNSLLDKLKSNILDFIEKMKKFSIKKKTKLFTIYLNNCKYVDNIIFRTTFIYRNNQHPTTVAEYLNNSGELDSFTGKLKEPIIDVTLELNKDYIFDNLTLRSSVSHELTHLIDDYEELNRGHLSVNYRNDIGDIQILKGLKDSNEIFDALFSILYLDNKFEKKAFINQTYYEFEKIGCTPYDYREKYKETLSYNNYINGLDFAINQLQQASNEDLKETNYLLNTVYRIKAIPKMNIGTFNGGEYRQKLIGIAEKIKKDFLKKYGGVLTAYIRDYKLKHNMLY